MKIDPVSIVLNKNFKFDKKIYLISGNEITLINEIKNQIIDDYKKKSMFVENIKNVKNRSKSVGLFEKNKVFIVNDITNVTEESLEKLLLDEDIYVFVSENSPKNRILKNIFSKNKNFYLIDCYEITVENKNKILRNFLSDSNFKISNELYWLMVEKLDNRYGILKNELDKLGKLNLSLYDDNSLLQALSGSVLSGNKIFLSLLSENKKLISVYQQRVTTNNDVFEFYHSLKQVCYLIVGNDNKDGFSKSIPKYMFREKDFLINVYNKYNNQKKVALLKLLLKTDKLMRLQGSLVQVIGLRFLLNFKKITIS